MSGPAINLRKPALAAAMALVLAAPSAMALKSDRQQPLDVKADATEGTLGDGTATLRGHVEIRQGTLLIQADTAQVERIEGRVRRFELTGTPVHLQQEIEAEGVVTAEAQQVDYEVATGLVTLTGAADVVHPQYRISGEVLRYDMNEQHFQGSGSDAEGRIRIQMDPEVLQQGDLPGTAPEPAAPAEADERADEGAGEPVAEPAAEPDSD